MISGAMSPLISAGRYQLPLGTYRVATEDLLWFLLCVAFLPLTRRRFRLAPDGLDATTSFGRKRFVRWDDVASLHFSVLFGFVLTLVDGRRLYLPGALYGLASFSEEAAAQLPAERMTARAKARVSLDRARLS
jgi:hypothetical protein